MNLVPMSNSIDLGPKILMVYQRFSYSISNASGIGDKISSLLILMELDTNITNFIKDYYYRRGTRR